MGAIIYGTFDIEIDDRTLTHLQIVIVNRFRHGDSLLMSWLDSIAIGDGRSAVWLSPSIPIYFKFAGSRVPSIDKQWLAALTESAESSTGLVLRDEHGDLIRASGLRNKH